MSDSFGYSREPQDFWGDPPPPGPIDISNPGISPYNARADHSHLLIFSEFVLLNLVGGWSSIGAGYKPASIRRIGNLVICRGAVVGGPVGASTIATISADYTPSAHEAFTCDAQGGPAKIDVQSGGFIVCYAHAVAGNYISLSGLIWAVD